MADWKQSATLTVHGRVPGDSRHRSRRKSQRKLDDEPFDNILAIGDQYDTESEGCSSIAFTSSKKQSRVSKRRSHEHANAVTTEDPTDVYIKQYHELLQQQKHDRDGRLVKCWRAFKKALIGCCTSQRTLERDMALADYRYKIMKLHQEAEKAKELERNEKLIKQETARKLDAVVRKYKLEEQKKRRLQKMKKTVQKEWDKAVSPQPCHLTEEEVKGLKILRKQKGDLRLKIQRLQDKDAMSETCTCSESEDMSEDERAQHLLERERERHSHLKQQQLETRACETVSKPCHKCGMVTAVDSRLRSILTKEEMELLQKVRDQQDTLLLKVKALEDRENKAMSKTHKSSPKKSGTSQEKMVNIKLAQHTGAIAQTNKISQLDEEREMERWNKIEKLANSVTRWVERMSGKERNSEKELVLECSKSLESLEVMKLKEELMKLKETEREREAVREVDKRRHLLEIKIKDMARNFTKEREMEEKRFEERVREVESKCEGEFEAKMLEMKHNIEKEREMSQRLEEQLLIHQQKAKTNTLRPIEGKMEKQRQKHIDMEQELEQTDDTDEEEVEEQMKEMKLHFEKESETDRQKHESRLREIEEAHRQECEEKKRELRARRELARQQELELVKLRHK